MHQVSRTVDSITLSWSQPDQPNGVILDYELQYYEKVPMGGLGALPITHLPEGPCPRLRPGGSAPPQDVMRWCRRKSTGLGDRLPGSQPGCTPPH